MDNYNLTRILDETEVDDNSKSNKNVIIIVIIVLVVALFTGIFIYVYKYGKKKKSSRRNHTRIYGDGPYQKGKTVKHLPDESTNKNLVISLSNLTDNKIKISNSKENASKITSFLVASQINVRKFKMFDNKAEEKPKEKQIENINYQDNFSHNNHEFIERKLSHVNQEDMEIEVYVHSNFEGEDEIVIEDYSNDNELKEYKENNENNINNKFIFKTETEKEYDNISNNATNNVSKIVKHEHIEEIL